MGVRAVAAVAAVCFLPACSYYTVEPGHRGLRFDPHAGGLKQEVLPPAIYNLGWCVLRDCGRVDDFDVTYSTERENIVTVSREGLSMAIHLAIRYRPVISELYDLDNEIGLGYYQEVIAPEFRSSARGVFARHSYQELMAKNDKIEDEIEAEVRRRTNGKHVEIASITIERIDYAPEIANAVRQKLVAEQEALRQKAAVEAEALRKKTQIETEAAAARLRSQTAAEQEKTNAELELLKRKNQKALAEEQVGVEKAQAEARVLKAKGEAEEIKVLAHAHAEENRAQTQNVSPLTVQMAAYEALGKLGGTGTTIFLGDWSRVPQFLFPHILSGLMPYAMPQAQPQAQARAGDGPR